MRSTDWSGRVAPVVAVAVAVAVALTGAAGVGCADDPGGQEASDGPGAGLDAAATGDGAAGADVGADAGADVGTGDDAGAGDASADDAAGGDASPGDGGPPPWSRGTAWVRQNPMFISGLTVTMGPPPAVFVNDYFDGFHATAVHLWENGLPTEMNGWAAANHPRYRWVSWTDQDGTSLDGHLLAGGYPANSPGRIGYQVWDEPGSLAELDLVNAGVDALRAHDPDALVIVNFSFMADEIDAMLVRYGTQMDGDIVSYDSYTRSNSAYRRLAQFRAAGLAYGRPYWRYLNSYMGNAREDVHDESDLRWDAFAGLVYGYTGHTWFLYQVPEGGVLVPVLYTAGGSFTAPKTDRWLIVAQINQELGHLGRAITQLTSTDVRYVPTVDLNLPWGTVRWQPGAGGDPYLSGVDRAPGQTLLEFLVGFFRDDAGEAYVMVQNVRHLHGPFPIDRATAGTVRLSFDFTAAPAGVDRTAVQRLNQLTGAVETVPLTSVQGTGGYLDVTLAAGDPLLFKYLTGAPFALQP